MTAAWAFYPKTETVNYKNPISGDFFSTEAVRNAATALVREGIQNSLDARVDRQSGSARVRIYLSETSGALSSVRAHHWFDSLWPHLTATDSGIKSPPDLGQPCPFLVFEDFETHGLRGDPSAHDREPGNDFYNFFRAEGLTDKGSHDGGSRGVGKIVFPQSSLIRSFFGLTVRSNDQRSLLMGRSILHFHRLNNKTFTSEGYFGIPRPGSGFMLPCDETSLVQEFRRDFHVVRSDEPGLSLVVPWYDQEDEDGLTRNGVLEAVLEGFFYPILMGHLRVTLDTPDDTLVLDSNTIQKTVAGLGQDFQSKFLPLLNLAEWAQTLANGEYHVLNAPEPQSNHKWASELVPLTVAQAVRTAMAQHQRIALQAPVTIRPRSGDPQTSYFRFYLEHADEDRQRPVFIRDQLIIPDVRAPFVAQIRALVIVEDAPLAGLMRLAEGVAHTEWSSKAEGFKDAYYFGKGILEFVQASVAALLRIVNQTDQKPDPSITIDYFSIPALPDDGDAVPGRRRKVKKGTTPPPPIPPIPPAKPRRFRIQSLRGGFAVVPGDPSAPLPAFLDIHTAYVVRRGNPLKKYHPADFDVGEAPIHWDPKPPGLDVKSAEGNRMLVAVTNPDFRLEVTGFDADRDLYVKVVVPTSSSADDADADAAPADLTQEAADVD